MKIRQEAGGNMNVSKSSGGGSGGGSGYGRCSVGATSLLLFWSNMRCKLFIRPGVATVYVPPCTAEPEALEHAPNTHHIAYD